jgi:hypothetical protein
MIGKSTYEFGKAFFGRVILSGGQELLGHSIDQATCCGRRLALHQLFNLRQYCRGMTLSVRLAAGDFLQVPQLLSHAGEAFNS